MRAHPGVRPLRLAADGHTPELLDQRRLPAEEIWLPVRTVDDTAHAIEDMVVRGAPAIACAAALGLARAARDFDPAPARFSSMLDDAFARLARTRPTAVNLFVALEELRTAVRACPPDAPAHERVAALTRAAHAHVDADLAACLRMAEHGADLLPREGGVLTHCNAGALATAGHGTALGVIRTAWARGHRLRVFADETRPVLQGARLTAWELARDGIPVEVICDSMAPALMARGEIRAAIVGADRIAANGDVANKIGTYAVAVACRHHGIPLYVAAPWTTIDLATATGADIPIEQRAEDEVRVHGGARLVPDDANVRNPAFDVTPAELVRAIITERGVFAPGELARAPAAP